MILVTGGAGFIGSNLLAGLEEFRTGPIIVCDYKTAGGNCRNIEKRKISDFIEPHELFSFLKNYLTTEKCATPKQCHFSEDANVLK